MHKEKENWSKEYFINGNIKVRQQMKNTKPQVVHSIATCNECPWLADEYRSALVAAKKHVKDTGHEVLIERAYSWYIKPQKKSDSK